MKIIFIPLYETALKMRKHVVQVVLKKTDSSVDMEEQKEDILQKVMTFWPLTFCWYWFLDLGFDLCIYMVKIVTLHGVPQEYWFLAPTYVSASNLIGSTFMWKGT